MNGIKRREPCIMIYKNFSEIQLDRLHLFKFTYFYCRLITYPLNLGMT